MSETFSRVLYPFDLARCPSPEPEVKRAILARWSSNSRPVWSGAKREKASDQVSSARSAKGFGLSREQSWG